MAANNYVPGAWHGIVRSRTAILLGPDTPPQLVRSLWELLESGPEVHELLHAVTSSFGVSLANIPPFGIVDFKDSLRVFLRGDIDLTVQLPGGPLELHGRDVTTWAERHLAAPEWYRISVSEGETAGPALPLQEGVVLLSALTAGMDGTPDGAAARPFAVQAIAAPAAAAPDAAVPAPAVSDVAVPDAAVSDAAVPDVAVPDAAVSVDAAPLMPLDPEPVEPAEPEELSPENGADGATSTDAPEHGASAETVMGVMDDEYDDLPAAEAGTGPVEDAVPTEPAVSPAGEEPPSDQAVPASEQTSTYDHLWERTVVRSIEDAAVRDDPDGLLSDVPAEEPAPADAPEPPLPVGPVVMPAPAEMPRSVAPAPSPAPPAPLPGGLIDSVPWRTAAGTPSAPAPASDDPGHDDPGHNDAGHIDSDHDGQTIMKSGLAGMAAHPAPAAAGTRDAGPAGPMVLARVCGQGHANPPTHAQCAACGQPLPSDAVQVSRPRLGRMRVSSGDVVDLDQSLVIGRQPSVSRVQGSGMPRLVQVASPGGDISRSHVEVRLEGWHVMLCDLKATNGTVLVREGQPPRRLAQNEMAILLDGDIADLGDGISLRFEEIL